MAGGLAVSLRAAAARLAAADLEPARMQAELLAARVLGVARGRLSGLDSLSPDEQRELDVLVDRRLDGVPLQHLLGSAPFRHLELAVGSGVFIPRPETELIVEIAQRQLAAARVVVDLCSGSGAIAISVATEYDLPRVLAVERSPAALRWLARNVASCGAAVEVIAADVADPALLADLAGAVDVVLANPPYVPAGLRSQMTREVCHDPAEAIFAGADGLDVIRLVVSAAARLLRPGGMLVVEHDESHPSAVLRLLSEAGFGECLTRPDLTGRPRFATAVSP